MNVKVTMAQLEDFDKRSTKKYIIKSNYDAIFVQTEGNELRSSDYAEAPLTRR